MNQGREGNEFNLPSSIVAGVGDCCNMAGLARAQAADGGRPGDAWPGHGTVCRGRRRPAYRGRTGGARAVGVQAEEGARAVGIQADEGEDGRRPGPRPTAAGGAANPTGAGRVRWKQGTTARERRRAWVLSGWQKGNTGTLGKVQLTCGATYSSIRRSGLGQVWNKLRGRFSN